MNCCNISNMYMKTVMDRIKERFNDDELEVLERVLQITANELMSEVDNVS